KESREHPALVLRNQTLALHPNVTSVAQHLQDRGISRGSSDAELLHARDQGSFRIARRRLRKMLVGIKPPSAQTLSRAHGRKATRFLVIGFVVPAFLVKPEKTVERNHAAGRAQTDGPATRSSRDIDRCAFELRRLRLACPRAQAGEFVKPT